MAFNPTGAVEVPLSVFSGLVTEISPQDLPGGASPDCQDVIFVPGAVMSRQGLQKVFGSAIGGAASILYAKSYVLPTGAIRNLYLTGAGGYYVEDPVNAPGVATLLSTTSPGSVAKSITAFGREYIATSDGLHGADIPLQFDGVNLDRVTQDGPGAPPQVQSLSIPPVSMATGSPPSPWTISSCESMDYSGSFYTSFKVNTTTVITGLAVGNQVTISGNANSFFNGLWTVTQLLTATCFKVNAYSSLFETGTGGTATPTTGITMTRSNNVVTVTTSAPHNLNVGYQAQITGIPASSAGGAIDSIIINNEDAPGLATITMSEPHGLVPGLAVTLAGIPGSIVGGTVSSASRAGGVVTIKTVSAHGLSAGANVTIAGVSSTGSTNFNTTASILSVPDSTTFTYAQSDTDDSSSATGGTVTLNWPSLQAATPNYYEVQTAPGSNVFQIAINYADGTWTGGSVQYAWDGIFFVSAVPSTTSFQYKQNGPNATSSTVGTVTPYGQATPGEHQIQVMFLTRQGYITRPSPPITFIANGGQYVSVSDIPIGPDNVVARILAFTGANGAYFYYIPAAAIVNGQAVSTATQINDNTTTSIVLDFSDNTLFAATGVSIPGNNTAAQIVLDGALGFGSYDSRLITYGQRNRIQNLLNLSFDGGYKPSIPTFPTGWGILEPNGLLVPGRFGSAWQMNCLPTNTPYGELQQSFFEDAYGAPIATANASYTLRCWVKSSIVATDANFVVQISSASTSYSSGAVVPGSAITTTGNWVEIPFQVAMPVTIPPDMVLTIYSTASASTVSIDVDEISIIYSETPYLDTIAFGSYVNNPEAFDGLTGKFGPADDTRKVMDFGMIRSILYLFTQEPSGRIHQTAANGTTEPSGWTVTEVGANCGVVSAFALAKSQADDSTASGGEEWLAWASLSGVRIFGGDEPFKISQEIQPDWETINTASLLKMWAINDPVERVLYFGLPTGGATSPNLVYPMDYRALESPYQIFNAPPVRTNFSGKLLATDNTRKWTRWNLALNGAALMYRSATDTAISFFGGNFGNMYTLNAAKYSDDDYGQIYPYYVTYFCPAHEEEMALQLGGHRKTLAYFQANIAGLGTLNIKVLLNTLSNVWPYVCSRPLNSDPNFDLEWGGGSAEAQRMAFKISVSPTTGTDNWFMLKKLIPSLRPAARKPVRGSAQ